MTRDVRLLTTNEVAPMLNMTPAALKQARHKGGGPPWIKLGTRVRYAPADVRAYLAANRVVSKGRK